MRCPFLDARSMKDGPAYFARPHGLPPINLNNINPGNISQLNRVRANTTVIVTS
jgi:hypothetical protein